MIKSAIELLTRFDIERSPTIALKSMLKIENVRKLSKKSLSEAMTMAVDKPVRVWPRKVGILASLEMIMAGRIMEQIIR